MHEGVYDCTGRELPGDAYLVRHTEVADFINCPRHWLFMSHNGLNLEPITKNDKLRLGSIWHKAMEAYYDRKSLPEDEVDAMGWAFSALDIAIEGDKAELERTLGDDFYNDDTLQLLAKDTDLLRILLEGYGHWSENEATPADGDFKVRAVERRFIVPTEDPNGKRSKCYLAVKADGIIEMGDWLYILEHKTRGVSSSVADPKGLNLDLQIGLQTLALRTAATEVDGVVRGVVYNLVRKQKPGPRVKSPIYGRHIVYRSQHELDNLADYLYLVYREMRKVTTLCKKYGWEAATQVRYNPQIWGTGYCSWGCAVKEICEALNRGDDAELLMKAHLKTREKDIWQVLEEEMNSDD